MKPLDLITTARRLVTTPGSQRPRQSDLKRAVSTVYYALFHALCRNCADCLIGTTGADRSAPAWVQAYRSVDHGFAKGQCKNQSIIKRFPVDIQDFANLFVLLQEKRHDADYDPVSRFARSDVVEWIDAAEQSLKAFQLSKIKDRRAFAAWTALKTR